MAEHTYLYGYPNKGVEKRLTRSELETKWTWQRLHPEMRRRILAMMDACIDAGYECGVGEGARSTDQQLETFLARHVQVKTGGCCNYNGFRYALKPGNAPAAPPGSSVHEDKLYEGYALAADLRGWENHWFDSNCARFGLKNFGGPSGPNVNNEEWHYQPLEFANARSQIVNQIRSGMVLREFPLPGSVVIVKPQVEPPVDPPKPVDPPPVKPAPIDVPPIIPPPVLPPSVKPSVVPPTTLLEEDLMVILVITDVRAPHARWKSNGVTKSWITGDMSAQVDLRLAECAGGTKASPVDGFVYKELIHGNNDVIASYGPILGPKPGPPFDDYGRLL